MSDTQERSASPTPTVEREDLPVEEQETLPVYPFQGKSVFRAKEMGDYFISQLQQQHGELNDFKSHTSEKINSIQSAIDKLTVLLERSLNSNNPLPPSEPFNIPERRTPEADTRLPAGTSSYRPRPETRYGPESQGLPWRPAPPSPIQSSDHEFDYAPSPTKDNGKVGGVHQSPGGLESCFHRKPVQNLEHESDDLRTDPPPHYGLSQNSRAQLPNPLSEGSGRLPGQRLPSFFGRDDENVLSWLQKIGMALEAARVPENSKLANVAPLLRGDADSWFYSFTQKRPPGASAPTYVEFKKAIIKKYESSEVRDDHLRSSLQTITLGSQGLRGINDYVFRF